MNPKFLNVNFVAAAEAAVAAMMFGLATNDFQMTNQAASNIYI